MIKNGMRIIVVLLVVAAAVVLLQKRKHDLAQAPPAAILPVVVDAVVAGRSTITLTLPAMGIVSSDVSTTLSTKISGRVNKIMKKEGETVRKGDLLASIDEQELQAKKEGLRLKRSSLDFDIAGKRENLKAVQTALQNGLDSHARTKELLDVKGASIEQYHKEDTEIAQLKAQVEAVKSGIAMLQSGREELTQSEKEIDNQLSYTSITSPIDGILSTRLVMAGDMAVPGKPLLKITAAEGLYLDVKLPSAITAAAIRLDGNLLPLTPKNQAGPSGLREYRSALLAGTSAVEGEFLNIAVVLFSGEGLLLPDDVLLSAQGKTWVLTYTNGKAEKLPVTIEQRGIEGVTVKEDLAGRTLLLAKPDILLRASSGVPIMIRTTNTAS
ncbi:MAG: biotin/lipoyl-binding protein [Pseudomonadota bacterium]